MVPGNTQLVPRMTSHIRMTSTTPGQRRGRRGAGEVAADDADTLASTGETVSLIQHSWNGFLVHRNGRALGHGQDVQFMFARQPRLDRGWERGARKKCGASPALAGDAPPWFESLPLWGNRYGFFSSFL